MVECSILDENVRVGEGAIVQCALIRGDSRIGKNCRIAPNTLVGPGVCLPDSFSTNANSVLVAQPPRRSDEDEDFDEGTDVHRVQYKQITANVYEVVTHDVHVTPSIMSIGKLRTPSTAQHEREKEQLPEDVFMGEVYETLLRGYDERLSTKNLVLEINGSRFAYNISGSDLTDAVIGAMLNVLMARQGQNIIAAVTEIIPALAPVLATYCQSSEAQATALETIEVFFFIWFGSHLFLCSALV